MERLYNEIMKFYIKEYRDIIVVSKYKGVYCLSKYSKLKVINMKNHGFKYDIHMSQIRELANKGYFAYGDTHDLNGILYSEPPYENILTWLHMEQLMPSHEDHILELYPMQYKNIWYWYTQPSSHSDKPIYINKSDICWRPTRTKEELIDLYKRRDTEWNEPYIRYVFTDMIFLW